MKSYSGNASFEYEVERYKNVLTGELIYNDDVPADAEESDYEYQCITLFIEGQSYYVPAKTYGDPFSCFPSDGETEITSILDAENQDWSNKISDSEKDHIIDMIADHSSQSADEPDGDSRDDFDDFDPRNDNYDGVF